MKKSTAIFQTALSCLLLAALLAGCASKKPENPPFQTDDSGRVIPPDGSFGPGGMPGDPPGDKPGDFPGDKPGDFPGNFPGDPGGNSSDKTAIQTPVITPSTNVERDDSGATSYSVGDITLKYTKYDLDAAENDAGQTDVTFSGSSATVNGSGAAFADGKLTITAAGSYRLSGNLTDGQIVIAAPDDAKVKLVLAGLTITCSTDAAIYAKSADKVILTLAAGSTNTVTDSDLSERTDESTRAPAAIYGAVSLSVNGSGTLTVNGSYNHAIATKKTLKIAGGVLNLTAKKVGLKGNNAVGICGGNITVTAGGDAVKTEEIEDFEKGYVLISGGNMKITAESDGINGSLYTLIMGGTIDITTTGTEVSSSTGGNAGFGFTSDESGAFEIQPLMFGPGGGGGRPGGGGGHGGGGMGGSSVQAPASKGIKAGSQLLILGGKITVNSTGHCVHSSGALTVTGSADLTLTSSKGKGVQGHGDVTISGGKLEVVNSTEGIESKTNIYISGGNIKIYATDDGVNLGSNTGTLEISGGSLNVSVGSGDTDGIDSNNTLTITGGVVTVKSQYATGNMAALDADRTITVSGGTVVLLCGGSGLSSNSMRSLQTVKLSGTLAVGDYKVVDGDGKTVFEFYVPASTSGCWIGSALLESGGSYKLVGSDGSAIKSWTQTGSSVSA